MNIQEIEIDKLIPYHNNPRKDQAIDKVASSINEYGFQQPIVVDKKKMNVEIKGINNIGQLCCSHNGKLNFYNFNEVEIIKDEILCD